MDRREFLAGSLLGLAGAAIRPACVAAPDPGPPVPAPPAAAAVEVPLLAPEPTWEQVRAQFALAPDLIHLGALLLASHPRVVREAIERHRRGLDENPVTYWVKNNRRLLDETLEQAGAYFGVDPADVALTDSTTMGLALVYNGLAVGPGDELVASRHDHWATRDSLRLKARKSGARVRLVRTYDDPSRVTEDALVAAYAKAIRPRTRVLAVTWVHSANGVKLPVRRIADLVATRNAKLAPENRVLLVVDGVHGFGVEDANFADLGCDLFVAGTHKWIFGPRGTGVIYARPDAWERTSPTIPTFAPRTSPGRIMTPGGFHSFEHRWALPEAFLFQHAVGKARIAERTRALATQLKEGLAAMRHVRVLTPASPAVSAGLVLFEVEGLQPSEVVERLYDKGIVITRAPYGTKSPRLAPSLVNTPKDIEVALRAIRDLA